MKKISKILLGLYTGLMPIFYWYGVDFREAQMKLWQSFAVVFLFLSMACINKTQENIKKTLPMACFGIWAYILYALTGFSLGGQIFTNIMYGIIIYYVFISIYDKKDFKIIPLILFFVAAYNILLMVMQVYLFDPIYIASDPGADQNDPIGSFCIKSSMGVFFASIWGFWIVWLESVNVKTRNIKLSNILSFMARFGLACIPIVPLVISRSTGAIAAGVASVLIYAWFRARKVFFVGILAIPVMAGLFIMKYDAPMGMFNTRPDMWRQAIKHAAQQPLTGLGMDAFRTGPVKYFMDKETHKTVFFPRVALNLETNQVGYQIPSDIVEKYDSWDSPHNEILQLYYEMGIVGVGLFVWFMVMLIKKILSIKPSGMAVASFCAIVALVVSGLTQFPFHLARIGYLMPLCMAIFYTETDNA